MIWPTEDARRYDCVVVGSCVVDLLCRPVGLDRAIGRGALHRIEPIVVAGGGITANSGITMARLGMRVGAFSYVGDDAWGAVVRKIFTDEGVDVSALTVHPEAESEGVGTSTTAVMIDPSGERSFLHCVGAPKRIDARAVLDRLDLFAQSRCMLLGYYSLMPNLENDLAEVLARVRETGCKTAMDAAGDGGTMSPLEDLLPHLDVYVPSRVEAAHQTGLTDPRDMIDRYRGCGAPGLLGVKLGGEGILLSPASGEYVEIEVCEPPSPVVDTTGAGDSFFGGLLTGLARGLSVEDAGRLGAAAAACCITAMGGSRGGWDYEQTAKLAGILCG